MAQNNISKLLQDFRTSITLPYYYKTKVLYKRVPDNILDASIIEGKMIIKYTMSGDRKKNSRGYYIYPEVRDLHIFTVEIDIAKSNVKKVDYINSVEITNDDGITISNSIKDEVFNETFF